MSRSRARLLRTAGPRLVLAGACALGGCGAYHDPSLAVTGVSVRERTADAIVLEFTLQAENPNEVPLPLKEFSYTVSIDGAATFTGVRSPEATLRRFGTQEVKVPAVITAPAGGSLPSGSVWCRLSGTLAYNTPGELAQVLFEADVRRPTVGLTDERSVELNGR